MEAEKLEEKFLSICLDLLKLFAKTDVFKLIQNLDFENRSARSIPPLECLKKTSKMCGIGLMERLNLCEGSKLLCFVVFVAKHTKCHALK